MKEVRRNPGLFLFVVKVVDKRLRGGYIVVRGDYVAKWKVEMFAEIEVEADSHENAVIAAFGVLESSGELSDTLMASAEQIDSCKFCGCTNDSACERGCAWVDEAHTVCSADECAAKYNAERGISE